MLLFFSQTSNARQKKVDRLVDVAEELSILYDRKEINEQQFITRMNDRYEELGYKPYQVYKAWSKILVNVKTRFESNNNVFAKASDKRMAIIQRKFEPNFCRPGISSSSSSRTNARRIDLSQVFSAANARQEPLLEFLGPDEHERETERVREMNIDTTLPDGRIVETEVLPGNEEEIQDVDEPEGPPTTNRDIVNNDATMHSDDDTTAVRKENGQEGTKLQRKRKRIRTNYTPKRSKKNALTSSIERRSSAQPSYAARTSPTKNIRKAARKTPAAVCLTRSRTTAAAAARPSRQTATISNLRAAPRQRRRTPPAVEEEEEEEDEEDSMNNSEPRRSSRLRDLQTKEQQCFNNLQESASSSSFDTPNQPTQLQQPQKHADERRDDSFEEYAPTSQQNALTTSNRRGIRNQQQPLGVNPLNRRQALLNQQQQLTPSRSQRPDEYHNRLQQRRADKQQLTEQAAVEEPEQITLEHPFQVEQPESAATLSQSRPPQTAEPLPQRQFERPGILRHPIRFGVVSQNPSLDQQSPGNYQQQTDMLPPHHRHQHIAPQYQFQQGVLQQPATLSHFGNFGALQCRPPFLQQQPPGNVVADHQQRTTTSAVNPSLDIQHTASATLPQNQQPPIHEIRQIVKQQIPPPSLQPPPSFTVAGDQQQQTATSALNSSHELRHTAPANPGHIEQFVQPQNPFQQLQQPPVPDMNQPQLQHTAPATLPQQPPANPQVVQPQNPLQQEQQTSASQIRFQQLPPSEIRDPQPSIGFLERITEIHGKFLDSVNQILGNINNCNNNNN
uniref:Uncharacterized protein n=1 Tax=Panagrolaimus superbus TaxID=310955 RepID=A0A914Z4F9_9BILA